MSSFIRFSLFTFNALSNIFFIMVTNSPKQDVFISFDKIREECIFIFLIYPFSTRAPNNIFKYVQILAT